MNTQKPLTRDEYDLEVVKLVSYVGAIASAYYCENTDDIVVNASECLECARSIAQSLDLTLKEPEIKEAEFYKFSSELKKMMLAGVGLLGHGTLPNTKTRLESIIESASIVKVSHEKD